jgi:WD40-like Beta Propeller Repeat
LLTTSAGLRAGKPEPFFHTPGKDERHPMFSPDGRWLTYVSDEYGDSQIYVRAFPGGATSGRWQISKDGGLYPMWSQDGRHLLFRTEDNRVMVADCRANGKSFVSENLRVWAAMRLADIGIASNYDVAPDGSTNLRGECEQENEPAITIGTASPPSSAQGGR